MDAGFVVGDPTSWHDLRDPWCLAGTQRPVRMRRRIHVSYEEKDACVSYGLRDPWCLAGTQRPIHIYETCIYKLSKN